MNRDISYFKELHRLGLPKPEDVKRMVETIHIISKEVYRLKELGDKLSAIEVNISMGRITEAIIKYSNCN